jgi:hypothetical protein
VFFRHPFEHGVSHRVEIHRGERLLVDTETPVQHLSGSHCRQKVVLHVAGWCIAKAHDHVSRRLQPTSRLVPTGHNLLERERFAREEDTVVVHRFGIVPA